MSKTKPKTICINCRFAEWEKTEAGRLHPLGHGLCTWRPTGIRFSAAMAKNRWLGGAIKMLTELREPVRLYRPDALADCATYERKEG